MAGLDANNAVHRHSEVQPDVVLTRIVGRHRNAAWAGLGKVPWDARVEHPVIVAVCRYRPLKAHGWLQCAVLSPYRGAKRTAHCKHPMAPKQHRRM